MQVNAKYLKDENGDIISPVVSCDSIFTQDGLSLTTMLYR